MTQEQLLALQGTLNGLQVLLGTMSLVIALSLFSCSIGIYQIRSELTKLNTALVVWIEDQKEKS